MKTYLLILFLSATSIAFGNGPSQLELEKILAQEHAFFDQLRKQPLLEKTPESAEQADAIAKHYNDFLQKNPRSLDGWILFGKYLRAIGEDEAANKAFLAANEINPDIAVVKQQIGNYLAESAAQSSDPQTQAAQATLAAQYFLSAIALDPQVALYHYQFGELLCFFKNALLREKIYTATRLDATMLEAFKTAAELQPNNRVFVLRAAEAYFDLMKPQWPQALQTWQNLEKTAPDWIQEQYALLRIGEIYVQLREPCLAKKALDRVFAPSFEDERRRLLQQIGLLA